MRTYSTSVAIRAPSVVAETQVTDPSVKFGKPRASAAAAALSA